MKTTSHHSLAAPAAPIADEASAAAAIQRHCQTLERGVRLSLASLVALGASLAYAKTVLGYSHGGGDRGAGRGPKESSSSHLNLIPATEKREPWPKLAARLTGKSYFWCQTLQKAAGRIIAQLEKSEAETDRQAAAILAAPPAEWSAADYDGLSAVLAGRFDADTFSGLLLELGLGNHGDHPGSRLDGHRGGSGDDDDADAARPAKKGRAEEAQAFFAPVWQTLIHSRNANLANYRARLHALPLRSPDPLKKIGLLDLRAEYEAHLEEIKAAVAARQ